MSVFPEFLSKFGSFFVVFFMFQLPYVMNELTLTELDMGFSIPKILHASAPSVDHQGRKHSYPWYVLFLTQRSGRSAKVEIYYIPAINLRLPPLLFFITTLAVHQFEILPLCHYNSLSFPLPSVNPSLVTPFAIIPPSSLSFALLLAGLRHFPLPFSPLSLSHLECSPSVRLALLNHSN